ncbi:DUF1097 domain-containing protein [Clostridium gasigenes]|uniref:DUF1097 domain-containing protein n=1 Tax=Clostridium gasigenes TaxID=94869 RepID=UPI0014384B9C|nr:DUF1097 domain-containing protein [Clostridium gasigenes]NKF06082.1 DUF1097 domain-containing protein [Clostridium gasigenes]QSW19196.1 DUF1097 domain-containing protein [Clostridium gasigenes]
MSRSTITAISVGIFSGIWAWISNSTGLITWIGFIGCTSYFASGGSLSGLKKSIYSNISGIIWAMTIIICSSYFKDSQWSYLFTGFFSFVMCIQAKFKTLEFIPGAFCGCCCIFATSGNWRAVLPALICGGILGFVSDRGGFHLHNLLDKRYVREMKKNTPKSY